MNLKRFEFLFLVLGRFRKYDYENDEKNLLIYNSKLPPEYHLERIHSPVAFFSSENDWLATPKVC